MRHNFSNGRIPHSDKIIPFLIRQQSLRKGQCILIDCLSFFEKYRDNPLIHCQLQHSARFLKEIKVLGCRASESFLATFDCREQYIFSAVHPKKRLGPILHHTTIKRAFPPLVLHYSIGDASASSQPYHEW